MTFAFFDHTGDVGVALQGADLAELFRSAAEAFTETISDRAAVEARETRDVQLSAPGLDLLLADWLREALYAFDVDNLLIRTAVADIDREDDGWRLRGRFEGERFDAGRHAIKVLVKAVTYHTLDVKRTADGWAATVVFDI